MSRRRANSWQRFLSGRRTFEVLRYVGRSFLRVTVNNPRINRRGNQGGNREDNHNDDAVPSTPHTCTVDANARQDDDDYDPTVPRHADVHGHDARSHRGEVRDDEVEHLRSLEFYRRVRILADETHSWNSALTLYQQETRPLLLGHYRTAHFVQDLADGEHDNYYSDLRSYVGLTSEETVLATLVARADPHSPPRIALTVPPIYEPSDVPPYTATISPPMYSTQSNPPPKVWCAYNYMVLGIAQPHHLAKVNAFLRCHSHPWRPQCEHDPSTLRQANDQPDDIKIVPPSSQSQERIGRIPCPQSLIPVAEIENQGLEQNRDLGPGSITENLMDFLERERPRSAMPPRLGNGDVQHRSSNRRHHHRSAVHLQSAITRNDPTALTDPSAFDPPLPINLRRDDATLSEQISHLSEVPDAVSSPRSPASTTIARSIPTGMPLTEASTDNVPYSPHSRRTRYGGFNHQRTVSDDYERLQAGAYAVPLLPARAERQYHYHRSLQRRAPPSSPTEAVPGRPALSRVPSDEILPPLTNNAHTNHDSAFPRSCIPAADRVDADRDYTDAHTATTTRGLSDEDRVYYQRLIARARALSEESP
ncbi:MAG: hypothetical protein LQ343_002267 [Gyalolechia ehrenbergii]|nr:MAG: hypothetical protein LQ343_002267 [Gyalolechia ehrenbergii]